MSHARGKQSACDVRPATACYSSWDVTASCAQRRQCCKETEPTSVQQGHARWNTTKRQALASSGERRRSPAMLAEVHAGNGREACHLDRVDIRAHLT